MDSLTLLHELANPAASISNNVRFMQDTMKRLREVTPDGSSEFRALMSSVQEALDDAVEGCRELAARLSRFREGQPLDSNEGVDLGSVADAAVAIVRGLARPLARLTVEHAEVPPVAMDRMHLSQVLVNLLMNAAEAIPPGNPDEQHISVRTFARERSGFIEVEDSGRGIAGDQLDQVFEPHYTSKSAAGHGFGLSVVRDLVTAASGKISVRSELQRGTTFTVEIPLL